MGRETGTQTETEAPTTRPAETENTLKLYTEAEWLGTTPPPAKSTTLFWAIVVVACFLGGFLAGNLIG